MEVLAVLSAATQSPATGAAAAGRPAQQILARGAAHRNRCRRAHVHLRARIPRDGARSGAGRSVHRHHLSRDGAIDGELGLLGVQGCQPVAIDVRAHRNGDRARRSCHQIVPRLEHPGVALRVRLRCGRGDRVGRSDPPYIRVRRRQNQAIDNQVEIGGRSEERMGTPRRRKLAVTVSGVKLLPTT